MNLKNLLRRKPAVEQPVERPIQLLQDGRRLSQSFIWQLMEDYYKQGVDAWQMVPFHATSNAYIGKNYAELIIQFLLDYRDKLNVNEPVYIMEMAAGTGNLTFFVIKELLKQKAEFEVLKDIEIRYVMTDFTQNTINSWRHQAKLMHFVEQGILDFALFYPEDEQKVFLQNSQQVLSKDVIKNPLITIANYFFDTIRHDLFRIENHELKEVQVSAYREYDEAEPDVPVHIDQVILQNSVHDIDGHYYSNKRLNRILDWYKEYYENASIIFPISSFKVIENLETMSNNNLVLISTDKGFTSTNFMHPDVHHGYATHGGAFSYMVNYHSIRKFFEDEGGFTLGTKDMDYMLTTTVNIRVKNAPENFEHLSHYFNQYFDVTNLINNLFSSADALRRAPEDNPEAIVRSSLALVRMSNFDPGVFWTIGEKLSRSLHSINSYQLDSLYYMLERVHENFYPLQMGYNALAWIGAIYYELNQIDKAMNVLHESIEVYGETANTGVVYYLGLCYELYEEWDKALHFMDLTVKMDPQAKFVLKDIERIKAKKANPPKKDVVADSPNNVEDIAA